MNIPVDYSFTFKINKIKTSFNRINVFINKNSYEDPQFSNYESSGEYIKSYLVLSELMRDHYKIDLLQIDHHRYKCKCCFHSDNNPSLTISDYVELPDGQQISFFNCFACGVSGLLIIIMILLSLSLLLSDFIKYYYLLFLFLLLLFILNNKYKNCHNSIYNYLLLLLF